jgi:hypothetical protein
MREERRMQCSDERGRNSLVRMRIVDPTAYFTHREHRNRRMVGSRREGPFSTSLWAPWMRRSQIASAWVDSLM